MTAPVPINHVGPTFPIIQVSNSRRSWTLLTRVGRLSMGKIRTLKGAQKNPGKRADFGKRDTTNSSRNVLSSIERIVRVTKHGDMLVMLCWSLIHWSFYSNVGVLAFRAERTQIFKRNPCTLFLHIFLMNWIAPNRLEQWSNFCADAMALVFFSKRCDPDVFWTNVTIASDAIIWIWLSLTMSFDVMVCHVFGCFSWFLGICKFFMVSRWFSQFSRYVFHFFVYHRQRLAIISDGRQPFVQPCYVSNVSFKSSSKLECFREFWRILWHIVTPLGQCN